MDWQIFLTTVGTGGTVIGVIYAFIRNFKNDINLKFEAHERRFESFERRFESLDNRIFQVAMGKSLPQILKEEKAAKKAKGEK